MCLQLIPRTLKFIVYEADMLRKGNMDTLCEIYILYLGVSIFYG